MIKQPSLNRTEPQIAWDDLRTSPSFPEIVGGVAGAVGGVSLMFIFSRLGKRKEKYPVAYDEIGNQVKVVYLPQSRGTTIAGFAPTDLITLATIGISLVRQIQDMIKIKDLEQDTEVLEDQKEILESKTGVPAPPAHTVPAAQKK
jgi:hypothetical protein